MRRLFLVAALLALCPPARGDPAIHYAPAENLEHVDVALIDTARGVQKSARWDGMVLLALRRGD